MDVDKTSFYPLFPDILTDIAEAHFVALDLELSGVPTKQLQIDTGKPSLQARYLETKEAAERYQILQFGITCVKQDVKSGSYILKPYNFDISPTILEKGLSDVERIFSFQSGACEFLLRNNFDFGKIFGHGVPYLSRKEAQEARDKHAKRQDRSAMSDIQIKPTEVESLAFLENVRKSINDFLKRKQPAEFCNIGHRGKELPKNEYISDELGRFEKRLVHQLVRAEYPDLISYPKYGVIQIRHLDQEHEKRMLEEKKRQLEEKIKRQKGFSWVIDALLGKHVGNINLREFCKDPNTGDDTDDNIDHLRLKLHRAQIEIRHNPRIIVGHNCFLDLIYIYRTFIGDLPDTVEEFQAKLHEQWPTIIDTKWLSTYNCGDINPVSSLEQVASQLSKMTTPKVEIDPDHGKYNDIEAMHEAGYDSYLTAQIAVRLSAKLERDGDYVDVPDFANDVHQSMNGLTLRVGLHDNVGGTSNGFIPSDSGDDNWATYGDPSVVSSRTEPLSRTVKSVHPDLEATHKLVPDGMPRFGSDFWRVYANRLRVFGTEEGVCILDSHDDRNGHSVHPGATDEEDDGGGVSVPRP